MNFRGTIESGRLVLDDGTQLPDGTRVDIAVGTAKRRPARGTRVDPIALIGTFAVRTGNPSLADEHDRFTLGDRVKQKATAPKRTAPTRRRKATAKKGKR